MKTINKNIDCHSPRDAPPPVLCRDVQRCLQVVLVTHLHRVPLLFPSKNGQISFSIVIIIIIIIIIIKPNLLVSFPNKFCFLSQVNPCNNGNPLLWHAQQKREEEGKKKERKKKKKEKENKKNKKLKICFELFFYFMNHVIHIPKAGMMLITNMVFFSRELDGIGSLTWGTVGSVMRYPFHGNGANANYRFQEHVSGSPFSIISPVN